MFISSYRSHSELVTTTDPCHAGFTASPLTDRLEPFGWIILMFLHVGLHGSFKSLLPILRNMLRCFLFLKAWMDY